MADVEMPIKIHRVLLIMHPFIIFVNYCLASQVKIVLPIVGNSWMQLDVSIGQKMEVGVAGYTEMLKLKKGGSKELLVTYVGCSINSAEAIKTLKIKVSIGTLCRTFFVFSYDYENSSHENRKLLRRN